MSGSYPKRYPLWQVRTFWRPGRSKGQRQCNRGETGRSASSWRCSCGRVAPGVGGAAFRRGPRRRPRCGDDRGCSSRGYRAPRWRVLEWLLVGEGRSWKDLASDIGVSNKDIKSFKKLVNVNYGVRHASKSGEKLKADVENHGTWVAGLIAAINAARERLDEGYKSFRTSILVS